MCKILDLLKSERGKTIVLSAAVLAVAQLFVTLALTAFHQYAGEIVQNALISFGLVLNFLLAGMAGLMLFAAFAWNFKRGIHIEFSAPTLRELPAQAWQEPTLTPDIAVLSRTGETPDEFTARMDEARKSARLSRWVIVLQKGNPVGMMYSADEGGLAASEFDRHYPPFETPDIPEDLRCAPSWADFTTETEAQYRGYVQRFAAGWKQWAPMQKLKDETTIRQKSEVFTEIARAISAACFVLLSFSAFGQTKSEQVSAAFNGRPGIPPAGVEVTYDFGNKTVYRMGDGRRNYAELLNIPGFQNSGGRLVAVWAGTARVATAQDVQAVAPRTNVGPGLGYATESNTGDPVRPRGIPTADQVRDIPRTDSPVNFSIPDSATSAAMADRVGEQIQSAGRSVGKLAMPWWRVAMNTVWMVAPLLGLIATLLWVWAGVSASEGMIRLHKVSRRGLVYVLLGLASVLAINAVLELMVSGAGVLLIWLVCIVLGLIAYFTITRIVPNFNPAPGNEPERGQIPGGFYPGKRLN